jgi:hypothetical protein
MKKLQKLLISSILVLSLSVIALADGGATHGPGGQPPPPPPPGGEAASAVGNSGVQYYALASELTSLMAWLEQSIL